jgi:hypothetical protein
LARAAVAPKGSLPHDRSLEASRETLVIMTCVTYVWKADGTYVGQVVSDGFSIDVLADDVEERAAIREELLNANKFGPNHDFHIRSGDVRTSVEFPGGEWIAFASLIVLPAIGYRVHVIKGAPAENTFDG